MKKGVSPVVAVTVLIMMAVLGVVAVWYWVSPYTTKPPIPETSHKGYIIVGTYRNASNTGCNAVDLKNTGGLPLSNLMFEVRDYATGKIAGVNGTDANASGQAYVNISSEITAGATVTLNLSVAGNATNRTSVPFGTYFLRASTKSVASISGLHDQLFTCR